MNKVNKIKKDITFFGGLRFLWKYIKKRKINFAMFYTGWFVDTILSVAFPVIFAAMIDEIVYYKNINSFMRISLVYVVAAVFSCGLYLLIYTNDAIIKSVYTFDIRFDIFKKLQDMKAAYMTNIKTGEITTLLNDDAFECSHFVIRNLFHFTNGIISVILYFVFIFAVNPAAGLLVLLSAPVSAAISLKFGQKIRSNNQKQRDIYGNYISWLIEILKGIADIRLLTAQSAVKRRFAENQKQVFDAKIKASVINITSDKVIQFVNLLLQLAVFSVAAFMAADEKMTIGTFTILIAYFFSVKDAVIRLTQNNMDMNSRLVRIKRIKDFMDQADETDWAGKEELRIEKGEIIFNDVCFSYDGRNRIFENFNLHVRPNEKIALAGRSGCGKTTVSALMIGFYEISSGQIIIDGQKLGDCSLRSIRQNIGIVQQDVLLFDGSIRENLLLCDRNASDKTLWDACEKAGIADFIGELPDKLDTILGKGGINLSGGQKQRLSIARIYIKNPKILIFDEATSALDPETEFVIHNAWKDLLQGRTTIIIAHRLNSVMLCERAALIEDGKITATGTPQKLCGNESFRELFAIGKGGTT